MKHRMNGVALFLCVLLTTGIYPTAKATEEEAKGPTHVYLEGVEIAPGVFEYRSDDGTVVISEPWEPESKAETVFAEVWCGDIVMNGIPVSVWGEDGAPADPVAYNGSIYVPMATVELWLGVEMAWTPETKAVEFVLDKNSVTYPQNMAPEGMEAPARRLPAEEGRMVEAIYDPDVFLVSLGEEFVEFTNAQGEAVYVLLVEDRLYLPVRGVSEFCGKTVSWEQNEAGEYFVSVK